MTATGRITTAKLIVGTKVVTTDDGEPTSRKRGMVREVKSLTTASVSGVGRSGKRGTVYTVTFTDGFAAEVVPSQTWTLSTTLDPTDALSSAPKDVALWNSGRDPFKIGTTSYPTKFWNGVTYRNAKADGTGSWVKLTPAQNERAIRESLDSAAKLRTTKSATEASLPTTTEQLVAAVTADVTADDLALTEAVNAVIRKPRKATATKAPADKVTKALHQSPAKARNELAKAAAIKAAPAGKKINYTRTYAGPKRSIVEHIREAFAAQKKGAFLSVTEIAKFDSKEYGQAHPSSGAVNAALRNSKKIDFAKPATGGARGSFGAKKS